jgi:hypothetical protein
MEHGCPSIFMTSQDIYENPKHIRNISLTKGHVDEKRLVFYSTERVGHLYNIAVEKQPVVLITGTY